MSSKVLPFAIAMAAFGISSAAPGQIVPPAGYSGDGDAPAIAPTVEPGTPRLESIDMDTIADRFSVAPDYPNAAKASIRVIGAYAIHPPESAHLTAYSPGFLPFDFTFGNDRCFVFGGDYVGGRIANAHIRHAECGTDAPDRTRKPVAPPDRSLKPIGSAWGYAAWFDPDRGITVVTRPYAKTFEPLFTAKMDAKAIMAIGGPDYPGGNITLVGQMDGRLVAVMLSVRY